MRKVVCTSTVFVALVAVVWWLCTYQVSDCAWWFEGHMRQRCATTTQPVLFWIVANVFPGILIVMALAGAWCASWNICGKLQAYFTNKTTERK